MATTGRTVRLRGIPAKATTADVLQFFHAFDLDESRVQLLFKQRRGTGEALVVFSTPEDAKRACALDKAFFTPQRYVRVALAGGGGSQDLHTAGSTKSCSISEATSQAARTSISMPAAFHPGCTGVPPIPAPAFMLPRLYSMPAPLTAMGAPWPPMAGVMAAAAAAAQIPACLPVPGASGMASEAPSYGGGWPGQDSASTTGPRYLVTDLSTGQKAFLDDAFNVMPMMPAEHVGGGHRTMSSLLTQSGADTAFHLHAQQQPTHAGERAGNVHAAKVRSDSNEEEGDGNGSGNGSANELSRGCGEKRSSTAAGQQPDCRPAKLAHLAGRGGCQA